MLRRALACLLVASFAAGCSSSEPAPSSPAEACDLASLQRTVLATKCATSGCHEATTLPAGDLDLASPGLDARLVGRPANGCGAQVLVKPGDPDGSYLVRKVVDTKPACGSRMPVGAPPLSDSEVACLRAWIADLSSPADAGVDGAPDASITCPGDRVACGDTCVDPQTDPEHCGTCSNACATGEACVTGACACTGDLTRCGAACVDTASDPKNCGACGNDCGAMVCAGGKCSGSCPGTTTNCGGACVDTQTDPAHCGGCGKACGAGQSCAAGACRCGTTVSFAADVQPIFTASCTSGGCHGSGPKPAANLSLVAGKSHAELVNVASDSCSGKLLVKPGAVDQSYLVNKLTGVGMCAGSRMPKADGALPTAQLDAIRAWICGGAKND